MRTLCHKYVRHAGAKNTISMTYRKVPHILRATHNHLILIIICASVIVTFPDLAQSAMLAGDIESAGVSRLTYCEGLIFVGTLPAALKNLALFIREAVRAYSMNDFVNESFKLIDTLRIDLLLSDQVPTACTSPSCNCISSCYLAFDRGEQRRGHRNQKL